jgi:hypothetical protein
VDERRSSAQVTPSVRWTRISREGGPWRVNVLSMEPEGRYFAADGNPAGVLASAGILLSEPVGGRSALALGDHERRLSALRFAGGVTLDGETRLLDGVNRRLGVVPGCGGRGGPRLPAKGRVHVRSAPEGLAPIKAPWFYGGRHPRTLAGVRSDGRLLLVTVGGRRPGWSAGVTLPEAARLMQALGARDALTSTAEARASAMTVRGRVVSRPSDPSGERPVSDALVVLP